MKTPPLQQQLNNKKNQITKPTNKLQHSPEYSTLFQTSRTDNEVIIQESVLFSISLKRKN